MELKDIKRKFQNALANADEIRLGKGAILVDQSAKVIPQSYPDAEPGEIEHYAWVQCWVMVPSEIAYESRQEEAKAIKTIIELEKEL